MERRIYADNAATTRPSNVVALEMARIALAFYGNPSSSHEEGRAAKEKLEEYRFRLAVCLDCEPNEIIFTSGATEGNNMVCLSFCSEACMIVKSSIEHASMFPTIYDELPVTPNGIIDLEKSYIVGDIWCLSVMTANNEIGTIQPVKEIGHICATKARGIPFHTDATAAVGHIPVSFREIGAHYMTCSAHKFHGPRGIGILVMKRNAETLSPLMYGGKQERDLRPGTENLPAVAGMTVALEECVRNMDENMEKTARMRDRLIDGLLEIKGTVLNGDAKQRLPGNVNVSFDGIEGEALLTMLDANGIAASAGSACHTGSKEPSHVLLAIGRTREQANAALRLSIDETNTDEEIDIIIRTVRESVAYLRKFSPKWNESTL